MHMNEQATSKVVQFSWHWKEWRGPRESSQHGAKHRAYADIRIGLIVHFLRLVEALSNGEVTGSDLRARCFLGLKHDTQRQAHQMELLSNEGRVRSEREGWGLFGLEGKEGMLITHLRSWGWKVYRVILRSEECNNQSMQKTKTIL